jgi:phage shock protein PspC (stress-responsive transcriptional regulator)
LTRPGRGGLLAGVCAGLADHLDVPVGLVRVAFVFLVFAQGLGLLLYAAAWILMPRETGTGPAASPPPRVRIRPSVWLGFLLAGLGAMMLNRWLADRYDWFHAYRHFWNRIHFMSWDLLIPLLLIATGAALVYRASRPPVVRTAPAAGDGGGPPRRFRRVENGKIIAGVCAGLAAETGIDPLWPRLAFAVLCLVANPFLGFLLYTGLLLLMEKPDAAQAGMGRKS